MTGPGGRREVVNGHGRAVRLGEAHHGSVVRHVEPGAEAVVGTAGIRGGRAFDIEHSS
ncbi:hypothetical protein ACFYY8_24820 [Streptosporangium sp. NPDC001559]|uniref:hypothetical protein n=1 Tax=Streptosporangium sp. NPDC001559 TaxID=3366187 RepID=UPI0036E4F99D